jgi:NRPS condensation-like uncharacterized protein
VIATAVFQSNKQTSAKIYDIDSSAMIYTAIKTKTWNQVFRVSVVLKQDVQPQILSMAIKDLKERFPTFYVQLTSTFFNYKLIEVSDTDVLILESDQPCRPVTIGSGQKPMFRVLYFHNRLSLEIFHAVTDGGGAMNFFKNIVARYLELLGYPVEQTDGIVDITEEPKDYETEDSFLKLYTKDLKHGKRFESAAYQYRPIYKENYFRAIFGLMPVDELKKLTKAKGVTITEYLTAVYIYAFYQDQLPKKNKKPIKISVPVDLRRLFGFCTYRNCALFTNVGIRANKTDYTFDEILAETVIKLKKGFNKETLRMNATANVAGAKLLVYRLSPVFIKDFFLKIAFLLFGPRIVTTSFSNFGLVTVPKEMENHIDHFDFLLDSTKKCRLNCGAVAYGNTLSVSFSSVSEATNVQRLFFTFLSNQGVPIRIQSNVESKNNVEAK